MFDLAMLHHIPVEALVGLGIIIAVAILFAIAMIRSALSGWDA